MLERGESAKKDFLIGRVRQIEENRQFEITTKQKKREKILNHRVHLLKQQLERVIIYLF